VTTQHATRKVEAGHYVYRNHNIYHEEFNGPEGGVRRCWGVSGEIGGPDEHSAHAKLPQLATLKAAKEWIDALLADDVKERHRIEREHSPLVWGN
jgi:hypothetical protein